ncbi:uncharacterized protein PHACADRAFT_250985 [Phanerochaete carnosa HHB-10118-sp]|uniref:Uncharacterized protein n=1 Tax=Phanerochaete carnosa (strain HHB-10118-sp) TaxID=650164 RepID=K5W818_PHACS|nr:uncharacterized protein PHACADRAFT_250985 [Phanerochaete carnosa HHB-10118-sp]EKM60098.1 hypothetical protein PHACADRAFT_250985 [Phanerochaete carnosa HHB-10118-sp]
MDAFSVSSSTMSQTKKDFSRFCRSITPTARSLRYSRRPSLWNMPTEGSNMQTVIAPASQGPGQLARRRPARQVKWARKALPPPLGQREDENVDGRVFGGARTPLGDEE